MDCTFLENIIFFADTVILVSFTSMILMFLYYKIKDFIIKKFSSWWGNYWLPVLFFIIFVTGLCMFLFIDSNLDLTKPIWK